MKTWKNFFSIISYKTILLNSPDKYSKDELQKYEDYFIPENYDKYISQDSIDAYNNVIGKKANDTYGKGINQIINETRQKYSVNNAQLPMMIPLFKQLMSKSEKSFIINEISNDNDLFIMVKNGYDKNLILIRNLATLINSSAFSNNIQSIYVNNDYLTELSKGVYSSWNIIDLALENRKNSIGSKAYDKKYSKAISIADLKDICDSYIGSIDKDLVKINCTFIDYFNTFDLHKIEQAYHAVEQTLNGSVLNNDKSAPNSNSDIGGKGYQQIQLVRQLLDTIMDAIHFYKPLLLEKNGKAMEIEGNSVEFYSNFTEIYNELRNFIDLYNLVRNYVTKKAYSKDKFLLNFDNPTLLDGWDVNKEEENAAVLLLKDNRYYIGIMIDRKLFSNYTHTEDVNNNTCYEKVVYKQISGASKSLPHTFFATCNSDKYKPSQDILDISNKKSYHKGKSEEDKNKWIHFMIDSIGKNEDWNMYFNFKFKKPSEYADVGSFYNDVDAQAYSVKLTRVSGKFIDDAVENGNLFLFQIYNKDFSDYSKGNPNLHTIYWRTLFSQENLRNVNENAVTPVLKLNGEAEIFFRKSSLPDKVTHPKNSPIINKNPLNDKQESSFAYDIKKDERFMSDKMMLHCPITINYRKEVARQKDFNKKANLAVEKNIDDINIIGIDRGERHLLYYTIINQKGEIIKGKQGSLNTTKADCGIETDYRTKLDIVEKSRTEGRKTWGQNESIKNLKQGYLSQVIHQLTDIMLENNAVIVLENLNTGFKESRKRVEKQVYQNFEKALIDKLNYLVMKNKLFGEKGCCLEGYQLTAPFESFQKIYNQMGFLYYVNPSYTSKICPKTGFVNRLKPKYESVKKSQEFFSKFEKIRYNKTENYFEFIFNDTNPTVKKLWTVCTYGEERHITYNKGMDHSCINVTEKLKRLFSEYSIKYDDGTNIKLMIIANENKEFFVSLLCLLHITLQIRYTKPGINDVDDYILSPVKDINGHFFDSRYASEAEPKNADANGAYHIALKGLMLLRSIQSGEIQSKCNLSDWLTFAQNK